MLTLASKGVLSCRAYCKVTQIKCLKATHERNWGITWGKELFKQAQYAATTEVEQMSSFSGWCSYRVAQKLFLRFENVNYDFNFSHLYAL